MSAWASGLLWAYGAGLVAAGIFRADPSDGFPPGTPPGMAEVSWHGLTHFAVAGMAFACVVAACFVLGASFARTGEGSWAWFCRITGVVFAGSFLALSSGSGGATTILVFTAAVVLVWAWLTAVSIKLYRGVHPA
jgi:O-antigen ligase